MPEWLEDTKGDTMTDQEMTLTFTWAASLHNNELFNALVERIDNPTELKSEDPEMNAILCEIAERLGDTAATQRLKESVTHALATFRELDTWGMLPTRLRRVVTRARQMATFALSTNPELIEGAERLQKQVDELLESELCKREADGSTTAAQDGTRPAGQAAWNAGTRGPAAPVYVLTCASCRGKPEQWKIVSGANEHGLYCVQCSLCGMGCSISEHDRYTNVSGGKTNHGKNNN